MVKEKILEADVPDRQGDIIKKDGVSFKDESIITNNFTNYQIGTCRNFEWKNNELYGEIELRGDIDKVNLKDKVFTVAGIVTEYHMEDEINVIDKFEIMSVSLVDKVNDVYD